MTQTHAHKSDDIRLPVLVKGPATAARAAPIEPDNAEATARAALGEPFNRYKVLNHFDRLHRFAAGENVAPITVEIDPSNLCNHRCNWCVSADSHTGELLALDRFRSLIDELRSMDVRSIVLKGGGEPTVHPQFDDMLRHIAAAALPMGLITNGSMPRRETPRLVLDTAQWVRVSLDAAAADTHRLIHGTRDFAKIIRNVERLTSSAIDTVIGLNFVAEPRNCTEILAFTALARDLGVDYVSIRCVFDPANPLTETARAVMREQAAAAAALETDTFRVLLGNFSESNLTAGLDQQFPYRRCLGPNLVGVIGADGETYACCFLRGNRAFSFGNINEQSFDDIWNSPKRRAVMEAVYRGGCGRACMGGMTANRYNIYNEILNYMTLEDKRHADFI